MKLTWFGGTTFRIYLGGSILVVDGERAPPSVRAAEVRAGADRDLAFSGEPVADPQAWRPRRGGRPIDDAPEPVLNWSIGAGALLIEGVGEAPLVLLGGAVPLLGRWGRDAVVVLSGEALGERGEAVLAAAGPRLIALAGEGANVDAAVERLRGRLDGTGLVTLERGLALEV